jgi:hypothetical protein
MPPTVGEPEAVPFTGSHNGFLEWRLDMSGDLEPDCDQGGASNGPSRWRDRILVISNGNGGALIVLGIIAGRAGTTERALAYYQMLVERGWYGVVLWQVFNEQCNQDIDKFMELLV